MKSPKCKVLTSFNILCAPTGLLRPRIFYWWCQTLMAGFSNFYRYKHPFLHIKQDILQYFHFYKIKRVDLLLVKFLAIDNALPDEAKVGLVIGVVRQWSAWFVAVPNWRLHSSTACLSPPQVPNHPPARDTKLLFPTFSTWGIGHTIGLLSISQKLHKMPQPNKCPPIPSPNTYQPGNLLAWVGRQICFVDLPFFTPPLKLGLWKYLSVNRCPLLRLKIHGTSKKVFDFKGQINPHIKGKHLTFMTKHDTKLLPRYLYFITSTWILNFPFMDIFQKKHKICRPRKNSWHC